MGVSYFKASTVNMKIFLLAFTLVMLSIQGSEAKRLSCLQCESMVGAESAECVDGTVEGKECPLGMADGCIVIAATGEAAGQSYTTWSRQCCVGNETHWPLALISIRINIFRGSACTM